MGRKKRDEQDKEEELREENRKLKSINRSLLKRLKQLDRDYRGAHQEDFIEDEQEERFKNKKCKDCGKGELIEKDLLGRIFIECTICGPKGRKAKNG